MSNFSVPTKDQVSSNNQAIFDNLGKKLGFVPNIYAAMAYSDSGLENYLNFSNAKSSLSKKQQEVVNLALSEINGCRYCQSAHTAIAKMNGFSEDQILELRAGEASFDAKLDILAKLSAELAINRGRASEGTLNSFYEAGFTKGNLVDVILTISQITVTNYLNNVTEVPIDFPLVTELEAVTA